VITVAYFAACRPAQPCRAPATTPPNRLVVDLPLRRCRRPADPELRPHPAAYKLEYTAVGFNLLPEQFTLSELQAAYETVLAVCLDKRNFRRRICGPASSSRPAATLWRRPPACCTATATTRRE